MEIPNTPEQLLNYAMRVMTWDHPRFAEFAAISSTWSDGAGCGGGRFPRTRVALQRLECDEAASLAWMAEHGGCDCDCEVLWNIVDPWQEGPETIARIRRVRAQEAAKHRRAYRLPRRLRKYYRGPTIAVDAGLDDATLNRLNAIPGLRCVSTCVGHPEIGQPDGAHIVFRLIPRRLRRGALEEMLNDGRLRFYTSGFGVCHLEPREDPPHEGNATWFKTAVARLEWAVRESQDWANPQMTLPFQVEQAKPKSAGSVGYD